MNKKEYADLADMNSCVVCCAPHADDDGYCSEACRLRGVASMFEWLEMNEEGEVRSSLWDYISSPIRKEEGK